MAIISSVRYCPNVALVTLHNVPCESKIIGEILTAISREGINIDMISQTAPQGGAISVAFTVFMDSLGVLLPILNGLKAKYAHLSVELSTGNTKLNFFDDGMVSTPGVAAQVLSMLADGAITINMITTSTVDISVLIPSHQEDTALELCRTAYGVEPEEIPFI